MPKGGDERRWPLFVVCLVGLALASTYTNHAPLLPVLMAELGFQPVAAGALSSTFFLAAAAIMLPAGLLTDRFGPKLVAAIGLLGSALLTAGLSWATSYGELLIFKLLGGIAANVAFLAGVRYAGALHTGRTAHVSQGLYGGAVQLGSGAIIYAMPLVAERAGWQAAFQVHALGLLAVTVLWLTVPDVGLRTGGVNLRGPLRHLPTWRLAGVHTLTFGVGLVVGTWATTFLLTELDLDLASASAVGSMVLVLGVLARPTGGVLLASGAFSGTHIMQLGLALNCAGLILLGYPGRPLAVTALGLGLLGIGVSLPYAAVVAMAAGGYPASPAAATAIATGAPLLGVVTGAPLVGWLYGYTGEFAIAWWLLAALCAVGWVLPVADPVVKRG